MLNPRLQSQQCSYKRGNSAVLEYILHLHFFSFSYTKLSFLPGSILHLSYSFGELSDAEISVSTLYF